MAFSDRARLTWFYRCGDLAILPTAKAGTNTLNELLLRRSSIAAIGDRYVAAMVRHPFARFVSAWADLRRPGRVRLGQYAWNGRTIRGMRAGIGIEDFAEIVAAHPFANAHWIPQSVWLELEDRPPEWFVCLERIFEDWHALHERFPELPPLTAARHNASEHGPWQAELTETAREIIRPVYEADFEALGYGDDHHESAESARRGPAAAETAADAGGGDESGESGDREGRRGDPAVDEGEGESELGGEPERLDAPATRTSG